MTGNFQKYLEAVHNTPDTNRIKTYVVLFNKKHSDTDYNKIESILKEFGVNRVTSKDIENVLFNFRLRTEVDGDWTGIVFKTPSDQTIFKKVKEKIQSELLTKVLFYDYYKDFEPAYNTKWGT